jgi:hypothetical protein
MSAFNSSTLLEKIEQDFAIQNNESFDLQTEGSEESNDTKHTSKTLHKLFPSLYKLDPKYTCESVKSTRFIANNANLLKSKEYESQNLRITQMVLISLTLNIVYFIYNILHSMIDYKGKSMILLYNCTLLNFRYIRLEWSKISYYF